MRLIPADPDIYTIVQRIRNGDIDLQPDFQRGEVWSETKKKRLIDSILRDWHVPPIHVVEVASTRRQDVLDGQQRLVAIREFIDGNLSVDGFTEPIDKELEELHGLKYNQLPDFWRRRFDQFTIRLFKITDYNPEEPGELFYRLNQPTNLTSAEQRNAFFGPAREQIKRLVDYFEKYELTEAVLKFSNSRMAYDDIVAKLCYTLELGTLYGKVNANDITNKYRSQEEFGQRSIYLVEESIKALGNASKYIDQGVRFNKATLFSWLCLVSQVRNEQNLFDNSKLLGEFITFFETMRQSHKNKRSQLYDIDFPESGSFEEYLFSIFNDRASSRVANVTSIITRDLVLWIFLYKFINNKGLIHEFSNDKINVLSELIQEAEIKYSNKQLNDLLEDVEYSFSWGRDI